MTIETIKSQIDIIDIISSYTDLKKSGTKYQAVINPLRDEKTSSFFVYEDTQKYFDFGTGEGGDVVDFIESVENLNTKDAISFLQANYLNGAEINSKPRPLPRMQSKQVKKDNDYLSAQLEIKAKYLSATPERVICGKRYPVQKWGYFPLEIEGKDGNIETVEVIRVAPVFEKLFEDYIVTTDKKFAKYLFDKVIGYCEYFNCPALIIRDESEKVVDVVMYRPERNGNPLRMKYLYTRAEEKPDSDYLFPLQSQMHRMALAQGYVIVGEGLKNCIAASFAGIPFISIESTSTIKPGLINFLKSDRMKNIVMIGGFDGDAAGEKAYKKINEQIPMQNKFDFNSGVDFSDYLKEVRECQLLEKL